MAGWRRVQTCSMSNHGVFLLVSAVVSLGKLWHAVAIYAIHSSVVIEMFDSILKFFQVDITGMFRMTSCARYFKAGVGSSRPNWRWIMCFVERPKTNTSCKALVKRLSLA